MTRDEDDRHVNPISGEELLKFETIEVRQRNVKYQAARGKGSRAGEEFLRGREDFRLPACETDEQFQRFAHRDIVVYNENDWRIIRHS
jgi:hypothetical protein